MGPTYQKFKFKYKSIIYIQYVLFAFTMHEIQGSGESRGESNQLLGNT